MSNLPPGCSSPDGGIDHDWESALEDLILDVTTEELIALKKALPAIREVLHVGFVEGVQTAKMEGLMESSDE